MKPRLLKAPVIDCEVRSRDHAAAYAAAQDFSLVAFGNPAVEKVPSLSQMYEGQAYANLEESLPPKPV